MAFRGRYIYDYPRAALTTDSVVFCYERKQLQVLLIRRGLAPYLGKWALPGGFLEQGETVEQCAMRELEEETGVKDIYLQQFHVFSDPRRDPREQVVTTAFIALVRKNECTLLAGDDASDARWFPCDNLPPLAFDHQEIISHALRFLQERLRIEPIAFRLLDKRFTMPDLQRLYETIHGVKYDKRNFARKMLASNFLKEEIDNVPQDDERYKHYYIFQEEAFEKAVKEKKMRKFPFDF